MMLVLARWPDPKRTHASLCLNSAMRSSTRRWIVILPLIRLVDRRLGRCVAVEPAGAVVGSRIRSVVWLARGVQPELLEHRAVVLGLRSERRQEVAHHHAVQPGLDGQRLEIAEVLHAPAAKP